MVDTLLNSANNLTSIRMEQARLLKERARGSAIIVEVFVFIFAVLFWALISPKFALAWFFSANIMIGVTVLYAKFMAKDGITQDNVTSYLRGHTVICAATGLVWGLTAIFALDFNNPLLFFVSGSMPMILTVGGMLPSSAYCRGYIALAMMALLPYGVYITLVAPDILRIMGLGTFTYFGLAMISSAQAELNTRDGIIAKTTQSLTEKLIQKNEDIQRAQEEKTRFLAATSHDLSQPLQAQGFFIQALREAKTKREQALLIDKIETSWKAQRQLLDGLVDITRLDSGAITPRATSVHLRSEMQKLADEFAAAIETKPLAFHTNFSDLCVNTDPVLLSRIIRNILSNALKFTPPKGQVSFEVTQKADQAQIIISDTGGGIPEAAHYDIFTEYFQIGNDSRDRSKGLGLGLSIVKRLVDILDIKLEFESHIGKGTRFILSLPLHSVANYKKTKKQPFTEKISNSPLIILVDDEVAIREAMAILLTNWGCQVISASTGAEAISLLSNTLETPALLIIDKRLSDGENGIELIQALREEVNETTPALLMTGDISGLDGLSSEMDIQLITKPVEPHHIKQVINEISNKNTHSA